MEAGAGAEDELPDLSDASNVLLLAPVAGTQAQTLCLDALTRLPPAESHVLGISYTNQPAEWVEAWNKQVGQQPAGGAVLTVGQPETEYEDDLWLSSTVESPGDLTGIGIELSDLLSELSDGAAPDENLSVAFDSVTTLLQYADLQQTFRFLHVVTGRVRKADARCYYHLNPTAHGQQTMATLGGLFDTTVEREDGGWSVTR
jgi:hypothetical protein